MIDYPLVVCIEPLGEDLTNPLVQEVIVGMILEEEEQGVVQVLIRHHLMQLLAMQLEYLCEEVDYGGSQWAKGFNSQAKLSRMCILELSVFIRYFKLSRSRLCNDFLIKLYQVLSHLLTYHIRGIIG